VHPPQYGHGPLASSDLKPSLFVSCSPDGACLHDPFSLSSVERAKSFPVASFLGRSHWSTLLPFHFSSFTKSSFQRPETHFPLFKPARDEPYLTALSQPSVDCFAALNLLSVSALHKKSPTTLILSVLVPTIRGFFELPEASGTAFKLPCPSSWQSRMTSGQTVDIPNNAELLCSI
jgi:hypothetical protein